MGHFLYTLSIVSYKNLQLVFFMNVQSNLIKFFTLEVTKKGKQKQLRNFLKSKQESIGEEVVEREARREDKREERKLERRERDTEGRDEEDQLFEDGDGGVSDSLDRKTDAGFIEPNGAWPNPL